MEHDSPVRGMWPLLSHPTLSDGDLARVYKANYRLDVNPEEFLEADQRYFDDPIVPTNTCSAFWTPPTVVLVGVASRSGTWRSQVSLRWRIGKSWC